MGTVSKEPNSSQSSTLEEKLPIYFRNLELLQIFIQDKQDQDSATRTIESYTSHARRAVEVFSANGVRMDMLGMEDLLPWYNVIKVSKKERKLRKRSLGGHLTSLSEFMDALVFKKIRLDNPVPSFRKRYLKRYKSDDGPTIPRKCPPDPVMADMILTITDVRVKAIHMVLAKTGLRRGELCSLDLESFNQVDNSLTLKPATKRSNLKNPIDRECADAIRDYLLIRDRFGPAEYERALFLNLRGRRINGNSVYNEVTKVSGSKGIHDFSADVLERDRKFAPHNYRVWFTTALRRRKCPERIISFLRGDAPQNTADLYDRVTWEEAVEAYTTHMPNIASLLEEGLE
jgi:integrase/recombinase XerD